jgi:hypothetical protein
MRPSARRVGEYIEAMVCLLVSPVLMDYRPRLRPSWKSEALAGLVNGYPANAAFCQLKFALEKRFGRMFVLNRAPVREYPTESTPDGACY